MNLDWSILFEGEIPGLILGGLLTTVQLGLYALVLAVFLGLLFSLARLSKYRVLRVLTTVIVDFVRSTPPLVQLLFWYFGASYIFPQASYQWLVEHNLKFSIAVIGLGVYTAAFISEVLRSGVRSLPKGQMEAALTVGLSHIQALRYVIFKQVLRITILPLINEFLSLMKNTSLAVAIGVAELSFVASTLQDKTFRVVEVFTAVTVIYLALSLLITMSARVVGRRMRLGAEHGVRAR